jgi:hypothetical protein
VNWEFAPIDAIEINSQLPRASPILPLTENRQQPTDEPHEDITLLLNEIAAGSAKTDCGKRGAKSEA